MRLFTIALVLFSFHSVAGQTPEDFRDVQKMFERMNKLNISGSQSPATVLKVHDLLNNPARADLDVSYRNKLGNRVKRRTFVKFSPMKSKRFWVGCMTAGSVLGCGARIAAQTSASLGLNWALNELNGDLFADGGSAYEPGTKCSSSKIPIELGDPPSVKWHFQVGCFVKKSNSRWEFWTNNLSPTVRDWADSESAISPRPDDYTTEDGTTSSFGPWWVVTRTVDYGTDPEPISENAPVPGDAVAEEIAKNPETLIEEGQVPDIFEPLELPDAGTGECDPEIEDCGTPPTESPDDDAGYIDDISNEIPDIDLEEEEIDVYDHFLEREGSGWLPKSCPQPTVLDLTLTRVVIDYSMLCNFAGYIKIFVMLMGSILWFRIVFGAMKDA